MIIYMYIRHRDRACARACGARSCAPGPWALVPGPGLGPGVLYMNRYAHINLHVYLRISMNVYIHIIRKKLNLQKGIL